MRSRPWRTAAILPGMRMRMRMRTWRPSAISVVGLVLVAACGAMSHSALDEAEQQEDQGSAASKLHDPLGEQSVMELLAPDEQEAVRRSGMTFPEPAKDASLEPTAAEQKPKGGFARAMDTAGKMTVTAVGVGMSVGMAVAPFFLF